MSHHAGSAVRSHPLHERAAAAQLEPRVPCALRSDGKLFLAEHSHVRHAKKARRLSRAAACWIQGLRTKERSLSLVQRQRQPRPVVSVRQVPEHGGCRVNDNADAVCAQLRDARDSMAALEQQQTAEPEPRLGRRRSRLFPRLSRCLGRRRWSGAGRRRRRRLRLRRRRRRRRRLRLVGRSLRLQRRCRRSIGVGAAERRRRLRLARRRLRTLRKRSVPPRLEERVQAVVAVGEHERVGAFCVFGGRSVLRAPAAVVREGAAQASSANQRAARFEVFVHERLE